MFIDEFKTGKFGVQFETHWEGIEFLAYLRNCGLTWASGDELFAIYKHRDWANEALAYNTVKGGVCFSNPKYRENIPFSRKLICGVEIDSEDLMAVLL